MDEIKSCISCGRLLMQDSKSSLCQNCLNSDEKDYNKIREYLFERPNSSIYDVATNLDIPISKIKRYLREDRLEIVEKENRFLFCESCQKPIRSGVYCNDCQQSQNNNNSNIPRGSFRDEPRKNNDDKKKDTKLKFKS